MQTHDYTLERFIVDLKGVATGNDDMKDILKRVQPFAKTLAASADFRGRVRKECDPAQGFGFQLLHEEPDHSLAIAALSWLPGRGTPPHDHGTWCLAVGVEGDEVNIFWKRVDDGSKPGYAELQKLQERVFAPGEAIVFTPSIIHSVRNDSDAISVSLHVYGKHVNHTDRSQFDQDKRTVTPWKVTEL